MQSKTPKFDALLDEILAPLSPHKCICIWKGKHKYCEGEFCLEIGDIEMLKALRVPPPNYCPTCRRIRRMVHMGTIHLFKRLCDAPKHDEMIISIFSKECPFPVYDFKYFISEEFDAFRFGKKYDETKSPLAQLWDLRKTFPMPSFLNRDLLSVNSEYTNGGRDLKNGYYTSGCFHSEDVWYSNLVNKSKSIMDSRSINTSEYVYNSAYSRNLYKCSFTYFSKECSDSMFLYDCRNCTDCFGCVNLRNKKYHVFTKELAKEEYATFMKNVYPLTREKLNAYAEEFWTLVHKLPMNASQNTRTENSTGILLSRSKNVYDAIHSENSENVRHIDGALSHKDSMDFLFSGGHSNNLYMTTNIGSESSKVKFSISSKFCLESEFIFNSKSLTNCFMCFGLENKSFCILNQQYTQEEYWPLVDIIKTEMLKRGEYADGPGMEFSAQAYNFSLANIAFPLSEEIILSLGGYVGKEQESNTDGIEIIDSENIPENIDEVSDKITTKALRCTLSGKPFKVIQTELDFYRRMKLPLPNIHPTIRTDKMYHIGAVGKKYNTTCNKCNTDILSIFDPKENYNFYCENCYQQEVV